MPQNRMNALPKRMVDTDLSRIEARLLLDGIYHVYGLDFRDYSVSTISRKATEYSQAIGLQTISALQEQVLTIHGVSNVFFGNCL